MSVIATPSGRRIHHDVVGEGPPLLAINGLAGSRRALVAWLPAALRERFQVIAIENRDAGEADPEPADYTCADMAGDAAALLDALGVSRAHILGYSMGATIALQLALGHPDRVDRLVLVSGHAWNDPAHSEGEPIPPPPAMWRDDPVARTRNLISHGLGTGFRARLTEAELVRLAEDERGNRVTWEGVMRQVAMRSGLDMRPRLGRVRAPTLIVHGDVDPVVPPEHATLLAAGIPGSRLAMLPGIGHVPFLEAPEQVAWAIVAFLEG